jgi:Phosphotransferase enzyme family
LDDAGAVLAARLGARPIVRLTGRGYTLMERWLVELPDGIRAFAKLAVDEQTAGFLRDEHRVYAGLQAGYLPRLLRWDDDGAFPILVIEDLSDAHWPPPWRPGEVDLVRRALDELHAARPPKGIPPLTRDELHTWHEVESDPAPFLSLGLRSAEWLEAALPELLAASERCDLGGGSMLHLDVRSDNICIVDGRAVLVDWNWASLGNPHVDLAFWLPSLFVEGGPAPSVMLPDVVDLTAIVSGFFAAVAGLPPPARAPTVRALQLAQLEVALPWAVEALGLPPLDR